MSARSPSPPQEHGSPVVRAVFLVAGLVALGLGVLGASIVLAVEATWLKGLLAAFGLGLGYWMYGLPSRS